MVQGDGARRRGRRGRCDDDVRGAGANASKARALLSAAIPVLFAKMYKGGEILGWKLNLGR